MTDTQHARPTRRLGTAKQACAIPGAPSRSTLRTWLQKGWISGVRAGGRFKYDLDSVAAMIVEYPRPDVDERIREIVEAAAEFNPKQISEIRLLLHAAPEASADNGTA